MIPDDHMVEALAANGADEPLHIRIWPGTAWSGHHFLHPQRPNEIPKTLCYRWRLGRAIDTVAPRPMRRALRICGAVHSSVGCSVIAKCTRRRRSWDRTRKTGDNEGKQCNQSWVHQPGMMISHRTEPVHFQCGCRSVQKLDLFENIWSGRSTIVPTENSIRFFQRLLPALCNITMLYVCLRAFVAYHDHGGTTWMLLIL